ncbi:MAG: hypothetical protein RML72_01930 [Bacteroidia bacterium]|nr:hypothetical protein [Bacteroidia bacterium]MDW8157620.1 hypothetical protein [Bacteroidia bacterium]
MLPVLLKKISLHRNYSIYHIVLIFLIGISLYSKADAQAFENRKQVLPQQGIHPTTSDASNSKEQKANIDELTLEQINEYQNYQNVAGGHPDSSMFVIQLEQMAEMMKQLHPKIFYSKQYDTACYKALLIEADTSQFRIEVSNFRKKLCETAVEESYYCGGYSYLLSSFYLIAQQAKLAEVKRKISETISLKNFKVISLEELDETLNSEYFPVPIPPSMINPLSSYFRTGELDKQEVLKRMAIPNLSRE